MIASLSLLSLFLSASVCECVGVHARVCACTRICACVPVWLSAEAR